MQSFQFFRLFCLIIVSQAYRHDSTDIRKYPVVGVLSLQQVLVGSVEEMFRYRTSYYRGRSVWYLWCTK